jgi:hypothetical protein
VGFVPNVKEGRRNADIENEGMTDFRMSME